MRRTMFFLGAITSALLSGCTTTTDPWRQPAISLESKLGPPLGIANLPPVKPFETYVGASMSKEDGTSENRVMDAAGDCLFAFKVDRLARRMVSWRFASKNHPSDCYP